jgi:cytochrome c oxidase assembly factor CtaG
MPCEPHQVAPTSWSIAIPATVAIVAAVLLYLRGWRRLRKGFPDLASGCRPAAFVGGMLVLWIVIGSPLSGLDHKLLMFHMVQHLLLMTVAAPLILLGTPGVALSRGVPQPIRGAVGRLLRSAAVRRIARSVTHPACCWVAGTAVVVVWHVPQVFELGMRSHSWHTIQHATFFAAGLLFWWPVIDAGPGSATLPRPSVPLYLFLATLPCDALSAFLAFCGRVVYPSHRSAHPFFSLSPLQDQECAGALMWFWVTVAYLLPAIVITLRMLSPSRREGAASASEP